MLGLTDFIAGALQLPTSRASLAYVLTLAPPLALAVSFPGIFLTALDTAGARAHRQARGRAWRRRRRRGQQQGRRLGQQQGRQDPGIICSRIEFQPRAATQTRRRAGTYGVLTLFGILPVAMAWSARYGGGEASGGSSDSPDRAPGSSSGGGRGGGTAVELVPGGRPVLLLIAGGAVAVIANEVVEKLEHLL